YIDLLSLVKINDDWKIVCRVYSRVALDVNLATGQGAKTSTSKTTSPSKAATPAKKAVVKKADDGW
ncbi:MAG: hypothetical protein RL045_1500, partial [Bacteroidota bacterium]